MGNIPKPSYHLTLKHTDGKRLILGIWNLYAKWLPGELRLQMVLKKSGPTRKFGGISFSTHHQDDQDRDTFSQSSPVVRVIEGLLMEWLIERGD